MKYLVIGFSFLLFLLSACSSAPDQQTTEELVKNNSGFLSRYDDLKEVEVEDDSRVMRFLSPELKSRGYTNIMVDPISYHPAPPVGDEISREILTDVSNYANQVIVSAIEKSASIATEPSGKSLRLKAAITELNIVDKELTGWQYIPISFLITAASDGLDNMIVKLTVEAEFVDSMSGESLGRVTKTGFGGVLDDDKTQLTLEEVKPLLDKWQKTMEENLKSQL